MKNILVVDGGPRRNMNTASLCEAFAAGARAASPGIEAKHVRLYDLPPFKGCVSCLACKRKDSRHTKVCAWKDGLTALLAEAADADGLAFASPIYFGGITALLRAFLERLLFPWLSYEDGSCNAPRRVPTAFLYTMNAGPEHLPMIRPNQEANERLVGMFLQAPERVEAFRTVQVADYSRYAMAMLAPDAHLAWRAAHWEDDLAAARAAGRRMAETILADGPEEDESDGDGDPDAVFRITSRAKLVSLLGDELESSNDGMWPAIDLTAQTVTPVFDSLYMDRDANDGLEGHELVEFDPVASREAYEVMEDFARNRPQEQANRLDRALSARHPFRGFRNAVEELGILQEWYGWKTRAYRDIAESRLEEAGVDFADGKVVCRNERNVRVFAVEDPLEDDGEDGEDETDG